MTKKLKDTSFIINCLVPSKVEFLVLIKENSDKIEKFRYHFGIAYVGINMFGLSDETIIF